MPAIVESAEAVVRIDSTFDLMPAIVESVECISEIELNGDLRAPPSDNFTESGYFPVQKFSPACAIENALSST